MEHRAIVAPRARGNTSQASSGNPTLFPDSEIPSSQEYIPGKRGAGGKTKIAAPDLLEGFDEFWADYPRKVGKDAARRAYAAARRRGAIAAEIVVGLQRTTWNPDPHFQPHPATWLNDGRWMDEPDAPAGNVVPMRRTREPTLAEGRDAVAARASRELYGGRFDETGNGKIIEGSVA